MSKFCLIPARLKIDISEIIAVNMSLCAVCTELLSPERLGSASTTLSSYPQHSSITNFLQSVEANCLLCWQGYCHLGRPHTLRLLEMKASEFGSHPPDAEAQEHPSDTATKVTLEIVNPESDGCSQLALGLEIYRTNPEQTEWFIHTPALTLIPTRGMKQLSTFELRDVLTFGRAWEIPRAT